MSLFEAIEAKGMHLYDLYIGVLAQDDASLYTYPEVERIADQTDPRRVPEVIVRAASELGVIVDEEFRPC